jgi:RNA polymerase sigma-70 factor (ECF subfamily)
VDAVTTEFDDTEHSLAAIDDQPGGVQVRHDAKETLGRALDRLAPEFREVIVLRELQGLSYKEIGEVTGVPVGTVMSRLSRARARLQEALRDK